MMMLDAKKISALQKARKTLQDEGIPIHQDIEFRMQSYENSLALKLAQACQRVNTDTHSLKDLQKLLANNVRFL